MWNTSTQKSSWSFTTEKLAEIRLKTFKSAVDRYPEIDLTKEQHLQIISNNEKKIQHISIKLALNINTVYSALIYFKRFFLYHTIFEYDINLTMIGCILLATKVQEDRRLGLDDILNEIENIAGKKFKREEIVKNEEKIILGLNMDFYLFLPFYSHYGFTSDLNNENPSETRKISDLAMKSIIKSFFTDIPLLYPPGTIALAFLHQLNNELIQNYVKQRKSEPFLTLLECDFKHIKSILDSFEFKDTKDLEVKLKGIRKSVSQKIEKIELDLSESMKREQDSKMERKIKEGNEARKNLLK